MIQISALLRIGAAVGLMVFTVHIVSTPAVAGAAAGSTGPAASARLGAVEFTFALERSVFQSGETIRFILTMTNVGSQPTTVEFPTSQPYDVLVFREGELVWQWSEGMVFLQVLTRVPLGPGESRTDRILWNQRDRIGRQVAPGAYRAEARFPVMGAPRIAAELSFRIGAGAAPRATIVARAEDGRSAVVVNGRVALRMRISAGGLAPAERAAIIAERLRRLIEQGLRPEELRVARVGGEAAIVARDRLVVTADTAHARLNRTTPILLARLWRELLVAALSS